MDPITLAMIPLTLLATKATETVGERLGEGVVAAGQMLLAALRKQSPETVKRLEAASDPNVIDVEIIEEEIRQAAAADPEVKAAVEATAVQMQQQTQMTNINLGKAANIGTVLQQINHF